MADETTQPALTAEEWRLLKLWTAGKMPGGKVRGMVVLDLPDSHRHGAAACALYGEPYGFTQEDVEALRDAFFVLTEHGGDSGSIGHIADRIAALLPPTP